MTAGSRIESKKENIMSWNANLLLVVSMLFVSWANPLSAQVDDVKDSEPVSEAKDSDQGETTDPPAIEDDLDVLDPLDAFDPLDAINSADPMGKVQEYEGDREVARGGRYQPG